MELKNSKTLENLKAGFAGESQAAGFVCNFSKKFNKEPVHVGFPSTHDSRGFLH